MKLLFFLLATTAFALRTKVKFNAVEPLNIEDHWKVLDRADKNHRVSFRVNLVQRNVDLLERTVLELSDPDSQRYGQWMSKEQVEEMVHPEQSVRDTVTRWLKEHGAIDVRDFGDFLKVRATVAHAEAMLSTRLHLMKRMDRLSSNRVHVKALGGFHLPAHIAQHVRGIGGSLAVLIRPKHFSVRSSGDGDRPIQCTIVPQTIETQYGIDNVPSGPQVQQGVAEFSDDNSYNPRDIQVFSTHMRVHFEGRIHNVGPFNPNPPDAESTLDILWASSTGRNATNWFYTVDGWLLEWTQDLFRSHNPSTLWSISWGADERQEGKSFNDQVDTEFRKLNARGITFLSASGDTGAPGTSCGSQHALNPSYPAASSAVLSVGATMFTSAALNPKINTSFCGQSASPPCAYKGTEAPADVPQVDFSSGGGFSVFEPMPEWQKSAVNQYLQDSSIPKPPSHLWNRSNRGYPDVGAIGWNVIIRLNNQWTPIGGTSASSPTFMGILSVIARQTGTGSKPRKFGFINPAIYKAAAAGAFRNVSPKGSNNKNGCQYGFEGNPNGWDPLVGLGVADFPKLLAYFKANPPKSK